MTLTGVKLSDEELLRLMRGGDESAFVMLYRRRQGGVYRFALQMSGCPAMAEDVTQEVFMALVREAHRYDVTRGSLAAYLYGIARHHVLRRLTQDRAYVALDATDEIEEASNGIAPPEQLIANDNPLDDLTRGEMIERLRQAILALPTHYREALVLCDLHEMSYAEAARALDCAIGTLRSRLHRARALLTEKMRAAATAEDTPQTINSARCFA